MDITKTFLLLLRASVDNTVPTIGNLSPRDWELLFDISKQQAVAGLVYNAVEKLPKPQQPPFKLAVELCSLKEKIVLRNKLLDQCCAEVYSFFKDNGFDSAILKGQGLARLYIADDGTPLGHLRHSGDIDIWPSGGRKRIYNFIRHHEPLSGLNYHHVHFETLSDVPVEVHVTPSDFNNPLRNARLQRLFSRLQDEQCHNPLPIAGTKISVPTREFNLFYILLHIFHHYLNEGVGLRQLIDYYFVLKDTKGDPTQIRLLRERLKEFHMFRFARGIMWILHEIFGLDEQYLIAEPDENRGRRLLREILTGGNFGQFDPRINRKMKQTPWGRMLSTIGTLSRRFSEQPAEILWNIPFRFSVWFWRSFLVRKSMIADK